MRWFGYIGLIVATFGFTAVAACKILGETSMTVYFVWGGVGVVGCIMVLNGLPRASAAEEESLRFAPKQVYELLERASKSEVAGDYEQAAKLYAEVSKRYPETTYAKDAVTQLSILRREGRIR